MTVFLLIGSCMWAYIIGNACAILATLNPDEVGREGGRREEGGREEGGRRRTRRILRISSLSPTMRVTVATPASPPDMADRAPAADGPAQLLHEGPHVPAGAPHRAAPLLPLLQGAQQDREVRVSGSGFGVRVSVLRSSIVHPVSSVSRSVRFGWRRGRAPRSRAPRGRASSVRCRSAWRLAGGGAANRPSSRPPLFPPFPPVVTRSPPASAPPTAAWSFSFRFVVLSFRFAPAYAGIRS